MNEIGLLQDELKRALEHVSGKSLNGKYQTTAEMLHAFNSIYEACSVAFDVMATDLTPLEGYTVTVKSNGETITPGEGGYYDLPEGTYTYDCICDGYDDLTDVEFTVNDADVERGTMTVTVKMTATV